MILNDIKLSEQFGKEISDEYQMALEFIQLKADYSLIIFRKITEILCGLAMTTNNIQRTKSSLNNLIHELSECQIIHHELKERLHEIRKSGNRMAHPLDDGSHDFNKEEIQQIKSSYSDQLIQEARSARITVVRVMEDFLLILKKTNKPISVEITEIPDSSWKKVLTDAATSECDRTLIKAGKVYESLANQMRAKDPYNSTYNFNYRYEGLKKLAANYYEMSYRLKADITNEVTKILDEGKYDRLKSIFAEEPIEERILEDDSYYIKEVLKKHGNAEALYLHWSILNETESFEEGGLLDHEWMLEASALLGHPDAQAHYGWKLFEGGQEREALKLLESAASSEIDWGYRYLANFYLEPRSTKQNNEKGIEYLQKGIDINGAECLAAMGQLYYNGHINDKSKRDGVELILRSIQQGSFTAENFYFNKVLKVRQHQKSAFEAKAMGFLNLLRDTNKETSKVGRNEPCHCGSGIKYKRCCLNKSFNAQKIIQDTSANLFPDL